MLLRTLSGLLVKGFNLQDEKLPGKDRNLLVDHFLIFYHQQILYLNIKELIPHLPRCNVNSRSHLSLLFLVPGCNRQAKEGQIAAWRSGTKKQERKGINLMTKYS
jgi:hypothetical protein